MRFGIDRDKGSKAKGLSPPDRVRLAAELPWRPELGRVVSGLLNDVNDVTTPMETGPKT